MQAISLAPTTVFSIGEFNVTTTFILQLFVTILISTALIVVVKKWQDKPNKFQLFVETLVAAAVSQIASVTQGDKKRSEKILPLVFSYFVFILVSNLLTLIPGLGAISVATSSGAQTALFRSVLADYSAILVMTLITVTVSQIAYILAKGLGAYLKQFIDLSNPLNFFLGIMNIIGELAKILSLSFRLFGNVFAGEVLLLVITSLIPFVVPLPFFALTLFSSVIQAYVFSILSAVFISQAMEVAEES